MLHEHCTTVKVTLFKQEFNNKLQMRGLYVKFWNLQNNAWVFISIILYICCPIGTHNTPSYIYIESDRRPDSYGRPFPQIDVQLKVTLANQCPIFLVSYRFPFM